MAFRVNRSTFIKTLRSGPCSEVDLAVNSHRQAIRNDVLSRLRLRAVALLVMANAILAGRAHAQSIWEVTPYKIQTWVSVDVSAALPGAWSEQLAQRLTTDAAARVGSVWKLTASPTPSAMRGWGLSDEPLNWEQLLESAGELKSQEFEKLMIVRVSRDLDGYRVSAREIDLATHAESAPIERTGVLLVRQIGPVALELMCKVFSPVVRIERIEEEVITAVAHASELIRPNDSNRYWVPPTVIQAGSVLQPVIRKSDRSGKVGASGVKPVEWTVMRVESANRGQLTCSFRSGYRQPFRLRRSSRIQQLAHVVRPRYESTTLRVVDRRQPEQPLAGYEVLSKTDAEGPSVSVGRTDWRGEIVIMRSDEEPIQTLYVRSGQQLLGKLPIVAGYQPELVAPLRNDEVRLEAEGFLIGVQDGLVDLVARREVLASRIRRAIEDDKIDLAETLLKELRGLDTREDFAARVQQRKRSLSTGDESVQQKIDDLFSQTRDLLDKYLDPRQVETLAQAIRDAKSNAASDTQSTETQTTGT